MDSKEYKKEYQKEYNLKHKDKIKERGKQYYLEHKKEVNERHKKYYQEHRNERLEYNKTNKGKLSRRISAWKALGIILLPQFKTYEVQYKYFYDKANEQCQICHKHLSLFINDNMETACLDHNHLTGEPRGILCGKCNRTIGNIEKTLNGDTQNISKYIATWKI